MITGAVFGCLDIMLVLMGRQRFQACSVLNYKHNLVGMRQLSLLNYNNSICEAIKITGS